ncbi:MAG TPA: GvpL/GvpF family gas vesicle protein [Nitrososphaera sp.]|nr:GvpL/GvpF family gas vesicle protein [Nitrososphaera sp.]
MDGRYIYCIINWGEKKPIGNFGNIGIGENPVYTIDYKDIAAVVSTIPFKQMDSNMNDIVAHQRVVEAAREVDTVLPVRFGVILKSEEGIKKLLAGSYKDYRAKLASLRGKDEIGIKVLLNKASLKKIKEQAEQSEEIRKMKQEISSAKPGASYFLKMRLEDAMKNETLMTIDKLVGEINNSLAGSAVDRRLLKNDVGEIVLNAAYLVDKSKTGAFDAKVKELRERFEKEGVTLHRSGPWAPYSFC